MTVNERVREIRKSVKLTMEKFGERLGVGKVAISCIESGKNNVTEQTLKVICREFNISEEWLRTGKGDMYDILIDDFTLVISDLIEKSDPVYDVIIDILKTYRTLDDKSKTVIQNFILQLTDTIENKDNDVSKSWNIWHLPSYLLKFTY